MTDTLETGTVYEVSFIIDPQVSEEKLPETFGAIKNTIVDLGANPISEEFPRHLELAYTMEKKVSNKILRYDEGWFGWIKFELETDITAKLEEKLRADTTIVRFLLVKTVRENTISSKKGVGSRKRQKTEDTPEVSKEEIDREIEALVEENKVD